ncbi:MAG: ammonium transporter [Deltaproteobacteria bacterium]|nr:ammonium transporter [Deltaproteobacteria bacterium]
MYGPVCTVVWEGEGREAFPYPDSFLVSYVLLKIVDKFLGLRVSESDERTGLDLSQHDETAYNF